ncbi:unnamed protein product [Heterobilharzia americana]|nr:unnamed protein product [Heterobilharzia americana]
MGFWNDRKTETSISYQSVISESLFDLVKKDGSELIDAYDLIELINSAGISLCDPRLTEFTNALKELQGNKNNQNMIQGKSLTLNREKFKIVTKENLHMLLRILTNDFCIPDFQSFESEIQAIFNMCKDNNDGNVASYIPELKQVNPNYWGLSLCTVDGQRLSMGDSNIPFTIQSSSKPITYALALTDLGPEYVHQYVGYEPSGLPYNQISLNHRIYFLKHPMKSIIDWLTNSVHNRFEELIQRFIFHHYESHLHYDKKIDPRKPRDSHRTDAITSLLFAAGSNDLATVRRCYIHGVDFNATDYDGRTGLHVAASSGALDTVKFFIEVGGAKLSPLDRWGHTPLSDAKLFGHHEIVEYLERKINTIEQPNRDETKDE